MAITIDNQVTTAPNTNRQPASGWFEQLRITAKHGIVIGCVGFLITVALFVGGGYWAWNGLFGVPAQHNTYSAGQQRDVMKDAPVGWQAMPDCKSVYKRVYVRTNAQGDVTGYICK